MEKGEKVILKARQTDKRDRKGKREKRKREIKKDKRKI